MQIHANLRKRWGVDWGGGKGVRDDEYNEEVMSVGRSNITVPFEVKLRFALLKKEYEELTKSRVSDADFLNLLISTYENKRARNYLEIAERLLDKVTLLLKTTEKEELEKKIKKLEELEEEKKKAEEKIKELEEEVYRLKKQLQEGNVNVTPRSLYWRVVDMCYRKWLEQYPNKREDIEKAREFLLELGLEMFQGDYLSLEKVLAVKKRFL